MWKKGERFFAESPLSTDAKRFLLTFSDSSEERVLSDERLSRDQFELRKAIVDKSETGTVNRLRSILQSHWADPLGVEETTEKQVRWHDVAGQSGKAERGREDDYPDSLPAWDHGSIWVRDDKPIIAVSQPYPWMLNRDVDELDVFAERHGLKFCVSNYPSWHYPGECWFVEWRSSTS